MGLKNSGGISNPGLAFVQINYASWMYNGQYVDSGFNVSNLNNNPYHIQDGYYIISTKSGWVYVLAPFIGCILASIFHWKTTNIMRLMKDTTKNTVPVKTIEFNSRAS